MAKKSDNSVRIGSISIFALVIVLCISVMGMLAISTGRAALASSEKQAAYTSDIYINEQDAWQFVSTIDEALSEIKQAWWWSKYDGLLAAQEIVDETKGAKLSDDVITASFETDNGKSLVVKMTITDNLELVIDEWKASTNREMDTGDTLWGGN